MRTRAELRRMRIDRGEPGGFGPAEIASLLALLTLVVGVVLSVLAVAGLFLGWGRWWENVLPD